MRTLLFFLFIAGVIGTGVYLWRTGAIGKSRGSASFHSNGTTKFSPEEFIQYTENFSLDAIAGECISKELRPLKFTEESQDSKQKYNVYQYFYSSEHEGQGLTSGDDVLLPKYMIEKIEMTDAAEVIEYVIVSKQDYQVFKDKIIELNPTNISSDSGNRLSYNGNDQFYKNKSHFVIKKCLFIDVGYQIKEKGYVFHIMSVDEFQRLLDGKPKEGDTTMKKIDTVEIKPTLLPAPEKEPEIGWIGVNSARLYANIYGETISMTLSKGTKLRIVKFQKNGYHYCDFTTDDGFKMTAWIKEEDVTFNKPKVKTVNEKDYDDFDN